MGRSGGGGGERSGRNQRTEHGPGPPRGDGGAAAAAAAGLGRGRARPSPPGGAGQLRGYLGQVGSAAGTLLEGLNLPQTQQRIRTAYEQGATAVVTYTGILTDQLYHWWQGEQ